MSGLSACPTCKVPFRLFTHHQIAHHINTCLDTSPSQLPEATTCPICSRDLTPLTSAARAEHANRCADSVLPPGRERLATRQSTTRRRPRQTTLSSRVRSVGQSELVLAEPLDKRVVRFLKQLGLERYAQKFAEEEIDFEALRLLHDADFAKLRIPDAARRRIADALTAVPIVAQIQNGKRSVQATQVQKSQLKSQQTQTQLTHFMRMTQQDDVLPTQQFQKSRLAERMKRAAPLLSQNESQSEYGATQEMSQGDNEPMMNGDEVMVGGGASIDERDQLNIAKKNTQVVEQRPRSSSQSSSESSVESNLSRLFPKLSGASQISKELKLKKWLDSKIARERERHVCRLARIQQAYSDMLRQANILDHTMDNCGDSYEKDDAFLNNDNCDTVDLTDTISNDEKAPPNVLLLDPQRSRSCAGESIVISSNESADKRISTRNSVVIENNNAEDSLSELDFPPLRETYRKTPERLKVANNEIERSAPSRNSEPEVLDLITPDNKLKRPQSKMGQSDVYDSDLEDSVFDFPISTRNEETANKGRKKPADVSDDLLDLVDQDDDSGGLIFTQAEVGPKGTTVGSSITSGLSRTDEQHKHKSLSVALDGNRLKKTRRKAKARKTLTESDIVKFIQSDAELYDEILAMESVSFSKILDRLRQSGATVSKKLLCETLQSEGVIIKWHHDVAPNSQAATYMRYLNSDACTD